MCKNERKLRETGNTKIQHGPAEPYTQRVAIVGACRTIAMTVTSAIAVGEMPYRVKLDQEC